MSKAPTRSEQVIAACKQRKLTQCALRHIQYLLREFEEERAFDRRAARFGVIAAALLVAVSLLLLHSGNSLILI
jgi:hypothetical protein